MAWTYRDVSQATSLRWYEPDQVQRVRQMPSQPEGSPSGRLLI